MNAVVPREDDVARNAAVIRRQVKHMQESFNVIEKVSALLVSGHLSRKRRL